MRHLLILLMSFQYIDIAITYFIATKLYVIIYWFIVPGTIMHSPKYLESRWLNNVFGLIINVSEFRKLSNLSNIYVHIHSIHILYICKSNLSIYYPYP
jgi:hypothetical protein